jgi:hypothetical protein
MHFIKYLFIIVACVLICSCNKKESVKNGITPIKSFNNNSLKEKDSIVDVSKKTSYDVENEYISTLIIPRDGLIQDTEMAIKYARIIWEAYCSKKVLNASNALFSVSKINNTFWNVHIHVKNKQYYIMFSREDGNIINSSLVSENFITSKQVAINIANLIWKRFYKNDFQRGVPAIYVIKLINNSSYFIKRSFLRRSMLMKGGEPYILIRIKDAKIKGIIHTK